MTQVNLFVNSLPRELAEFSFFLIVGFTAGTVGIIWINKWFIIYLKRFNFNNLKFSQECRKSPVDKRNSKISWSLRICSVVEAQEISK